MTARWETPEWNKRWRVDRARGVERLVSVDDAADHIRSLRILGFGDAAIAEAAGVNKSTVGNIRRGRGKRIYPVIHKRIMSVTPDAIYSRSNRRGYVPDVGAVRRIQALLCMGWRYKDLRPKLGFPPEKVQEGSGWISQYKHDAVCRLFEELWDKRGPASQGYINKLLRRGWVPPLAWEEGTIDNPDAEPDGVREVA